MFTSNLWFYMVRYLCMHPQICLYAHSWSPWPDNAGHYGPSKAELCGPCLTRLQQCKLRDGKWNMSNWSWLNINTGSLSFNFQSFTLYRVYWKFQYSETEIHKLWLLGILEHAVNRMFRMSFNSQSQVLQVKIIFCMKRGTGIAHFCSEWATGWPREDFVFTFR
jgi:hypothetical protein